ncbi:hypothetical protein P154DRAFT_36985 [Amniculicola lignicola CBS 123094]|uniref:Uncharacterized protein n=1 Tax=Amniculicola lignicola CBS 123094 TaxID=1392246 RepID=A0A6A5WX47_9PLEO|nr:hypothetical protein P154DRAFT_36985 [Amniculicola lignicola CBS 123094]
MYQVAHRLGVRLIPSSGEQPPSTPCVQSAVCSVRCADSGTYRGYLPLRSARVSRRGGWRGIYGSTPGAAPLGSAGLGLGGNWRAGLGGGVERALGGVLAVGGRGGGDGRGDAFAFAFASAPASAEETVHGGILWSVRHGKQ